MVAAMVAVEDSNAIFGLGRQGQASGGRRKLRRGEVSVKPCSRDDRQNRQGVWAVLLLQTPLATSRTRRGKGTWSWTCGLVRTMLWIEVSSWH